MFNRTNNKIEDQHDDMVRDLAKPGADVLGDMSAEKAALLHAAVGVAGEAGELLDAIKKHAIYGKPLDLDNVVEELGDIEFYMNEIRRHTLIKREYTLSMNIEKLRSRYGSGKYSNSQALAREDKSL